MARHAFQVLGQVKQALHLGVVRHELLQVLRIPQRIIHRGHGGDQLRDAVHLAVRHAQRPTHVAHCRPRFHRPEGDDLRHVIGAVFLRNVFDDLIAADIHEVDVNVRHGVARRIEESLEDETVVQGIDVGNAGGIAHETPRSRTPHGGGYPLLFGPVYEVRRDQEVGGESPFPRSRLTRIPGARARRHRARHRAPPSLLCTARAGTCCAVCPSGTSKWGNMRWSRAISTLQASAIFDGVGQGFGKLGKDFPHLIGAAQVERILLHAHAVGVVHVAVRLDAQEHVVGIGILTAGVMPVVRGNQRQVEVSLASFMSFPVTSCSQSMPWS